MHLFNMIILCLNADHSVCFYNCILYTTQCELLNKNRNVLETSILQRVHIVLGIVHE